MIRAGKFGDIPRLVEIMQEAHAASPYADICEVDVKEAKRTLMGCLQRHGGNHEGSTFVAVAEKDGRVEGYIIGILQRFYTVTDKLEATDLQWFCTKKVSARDPIKLVKAMHKWAQKSPDVVAVFQANIDLWVDHAAVTRALEGIGMKKCGDILRKDLNDE